MTFGADTQIKLHQNYPEFPADLRHRLGDHPLLRIESLAALAKALPRRCIEYNSGDLPVEQDPETTPANGLSIEDTLRHLGERQSWMAIKNVEKDAAYRRLLNKCLDDVRPLVASKTGRMYKTEAFIFISSPGSVTPFHMDPEHNILLQIRGRKTMRVFPARNAMITPPERHEAFHQHGGHRNLPYRPEFENACAGVRIVAGGRALRAREGAALG